jgi:enhancing lycopene biosynthesis protein 2
VSFAAITLCVASQLVFIVVVYLVIDSVRKLLDTPSYINSMNIKNAECGDRKRTAVLISDTLYFR